eukprot:6783518-Ditylum_brightwellii.AAC.1
MGGRTATTLDVMCQNLQIVQHKLGNCGIIAFFVQSFFKYSLDNSTKKCSTCLLLSLDGQKVRHGIT